MRSHGENPRVDQQKTKTQSKMKTTKHYEDRKCDICLKTKENNKSFLQKTYWYSRAQSGKFCDFITADPKVLGEGCESRNNHRYAVVEQDLATQWIRSYPCKTKTSKETHESLQKFLEATRKPEVIYTDNSSEFGKSCEE